MLYPPDTQQRLRDRFAKACLLDPSARAKDKPLQNILLVGGVIDPEGNPGKHDVTYLDLCLRNLKDAGASIHPQMQVSYNNLYSFWGGEDFLENPPPADVVIMSFVYNKPSDAKPDPHDPGYLQSPLHKKTENIWHDSVLTTGARALWVIGNNKTEINKNHFIREGSPLLPEKHGTAVRRYGFLFSLTANTTLFLHRDYKAHLEARKNKPLQQQRLAP